MKSKRPYLVWVSTNGGKCAAELFGPDRLFDVALHNYGPWASFGSSCLNGPYWQAEFWLPSEGTEKFETAAANPLLFRDYEFVAFLDDDLEISTCDLNRMFEIGKRYGLEIFQPALTPFSFGTYNHLFQNVLGAAAGDAREVPFVEIMCPVFSKRMLQKCFWSFDLNQSGWGLDCFIWPRIYPVHYCLDKVPITHGRKPGRRDRVNRNGLTCFQECDIIKKIRYDGPCSW